MRNAVCKYLDAHREIVALEWLLIVVMIVYYCKLKIIITSAMANSPLPPSPSPRTRRDRRLCRLAEGLMYNFTCSPRPSDWLSVTYDWGEWSKTWPYLSAGNTWYHLQSPQNHYLHYCCLSEICCYQLYYSVIFMYSWKITILLMLPGFHLFNYSFSFW